MENITFAPWPTIPTSPSPLNWFCISKAAPFQASKLTVVTWSSNNHRFGVKTITWFGKKTHLMLEPVEGRLKLHDLRLEKPRVCEYQTYGESSTPKVCHEWPNINRRGPNNGKSKNPSMNRKSWTHYDLIFADLAPTMEAAPCHED